MAEKDKYKDPNEMGRTSAEGLAAGAVSYANAMAMADKDAMRMAMEKKQPVDSQFYAGGYGYKPADEAAKKYQQTAEEKNSYEDVFDGGNQPTPKSNWDSLREQSATDLLNANIQTEMAKAAAQRNLQNTLAAQGLDNSGYYGAGMAQLESNAMAQRQRNLSTYQQAIREQAEQTKAASLENLTNAIQRASSKEQIDRWLNAYGIEMVDGEPRGELYDGLSNETKSYIKSILRDSYENVYEMSNHGYSSADELLQSGTKTGEGNDISAQRYGVKNEVETLFNTADGQAIAQEGNVVKLQNDSTGNAKDSIYLMFNNGKWRVATQSDYDKADNSYEIRNNSVKVNKTKNASNANANGQSVNLELHNDMGRNVYTIDGKKVEIVSGGPAYGQFKTSDGKSYKKIGSNWYLAN